MRRFAILAALILILGLALFWQGPTFDLFVGLAFGWAGYCARVLPKVTISWDGVATAVICLVLFAIGLHKTLRWLHDEIGKTGGATTAGRAPWSARWTASIVALVFAMFVVRIAATGIVHQAGWLVASRRSLIQERPPFRETYGGSSANRLRLLGLDTMGFLTRHPSGLPPSAGGVVHSWQTEILPDMGYYLAGQFHRDLPWNDPQNSAYFKGVIPNFLNPEIREFRDREGYALSHYAGNIQVLGRGRAGGRIAPGGAANTILAGEVAEGFKPWGDPTNLRDPGLGINKVPGGFGGPSGSGANLLFMDGSVRFLRDTTPRDVLQRPSPPNPPDQ